MSTPVQYVPLISSIDHTFWTQLNAKKLDELKLDERPLPLNAFYTNGESLPFKYHYYRTLTNYKLWNSDPTEDAACL